MCTRICDGPVKAYLVWVNEIKIRQKSGKVEPAPRFSKVMVLGRLPLLLVRLGDVKSEVTKYGMDVFLSKGNFKVKCNWQQNRYSPKWNDVGPIGGISRHILARNVKVFSGKYSESVKTFLKMLWNQLDMRAIRFSHKLGKDNNHDVTYPSQWRRWLMNYQRQRIKTSGLLTCQTSKTPMLFQATDSSNGTTSSCQEVQQISKQTSKHSSNSMIFVDDTSW